MDGTWSDELTGHTLVRVEPIVVTRVLLLISHILSRALLFEVEELNIGIIPYEKKLLQLLLLQLIIEIPNPSVPSQHKFGYHCKFPNQYSAPRTISARVTEPMSLAISHLAIAVLSLVIVLQVDRLVIFTKADASL